MVSQVVLWVLALQLSSISAKRTLSKTAIIFDPEQTPGEKKVGQTAFASLKEYGSWDKSHKDKSWGSQIYLEAWKKSKVGTDTGQEQSWPGITPDEIEKLQVDGAGLGDVHDVSMTSSGREDNQVDDHIDADIEKHQFDVTDGTSLMDTRTRSTNAAANSTSIHTKADKHYFSTGPKMDQFRCCCKPGPCDSDKIQETNLVTIGSQCCLVKVYKSNKEGEELSMSVCTKGMATVNFTVQDGSPKADMYSDKNTIKAVKNGVKDFVTILDQEGVKTQLEWTWLQMGCLCPGKSHRLPRTKCAECEDGFDDDDKEMCQEKNVCTSTMLSGPMWQFKAESSTWEQVASPPRENDKVVAYGDSTGCGDDEVLVAWGLGELRNSLKFHTVPYSSLPNRLNMQSFVPILHGLRCSHKGASMIEVTNKWQNWQALSQRPGKMPKGLKLSCEKSEAIYAQCQSFMEKVRSWNEAKVDPCDGILEASNECTDQKKAFRKLTRSIGGLLGAESLDHGIELVKRCAALQVLPVPTDFRK